MHLNRSIFGILGTLSSSIKRHWLALGVIAIVVVVSFWQVFFLQNSLKWDMLDCYLPWRFQISESLKNDMFPMWNPYQQLGYPIHADMHSPFYPLVWLVSLTTGYSVYTFHYLLILYVILGGFGFYRLNYYFNKSYTVSLLTGVIYSLSGFFVGHGQELSTLAAGCFIPYVMLFFFQVIREGRTVHALVFTLFLYLLVNAGYQAYTIILFYFMGIYGLVYIVRKIREKEVARFYRLGRNLMIIILLLGLLLIPNIMSFIEVKPFVSRFGGLGLESIEKFAFTPQSAISFLLPFASVKDIEFFNTDLSMTNNYFSVFFLAAFIYGFTKRLKLFHWFILGFAVVALLASFGDYTPVRKLLFEWVPMMNVFRGSSYFSYYAFTGFLILAANALSEQDSDRLFQKKHLFIPVLVLLILIVSFFTIRGYSTTPNFVLFEKGLDFFTRLRESSFGEHLFLNGIIQLLFLAVFTVIYLLRGINLKLFAVLVVLNMVISVQLNIYYTTVSSVKPLELGAELSKLPKGFPIVDLNPVANNNDNASGIYPLWRNTNILRKNVSFDGYNSFALSGYEYLNDSLPALRDAMLLNPLGYLSSDLMPYDNIDANRAFSRSDIFTDEEIFVLYRDSIGGHSESDSVDLIGFSPVEVKFKVRTNNGQIFTLLQSYYPGWKVWVDGKESNLFTTNYLTQSVFVGKGEHDVVFKYYNEKITIGIWISFGAFIVLIVFVVWYRWRRPAALLILGFVVLLLVLLIIIERKNYRKKLLGDRDVFVEDIYAALDKYKNVDLYYDIRNLPLLRYMDTIFDHNDIRVDLKLDQAFFLESIKSSKKNALLIFSHNIVPTDGLVFAVGEFYGSLVESKSYHSGQLLIFERGVPVQTNHLEVVHEMEEKNVNWKGTLIVDSTSAYSGSFSGLLDSNYVYSVTYELSGKELEDKRGLVLFASVYASLTEGADGHLVFSHERNGEKVTWVSAQLSEFNTRTDDWFPAILFEPFAEIREEDVLKVYVWNNSGKKLNIDDMKVVVGVKPTQH